MCTTVCGGGTQTRHRQILENTGSESLCGETTQVSPCNLHECGFVGFCIASVLHMGSSLLLFRCCYASELRGVTGTAAACASGGAGGCSSRAARLRYAYSWRKGCAAVNAMLLLLAALLFWRHDLYCEPYVYSAFALCEWLFVASNVAFMSAVFIDGLHWHNAIFDAELPAPAAKCQ